MQCSFRALHFWVLLNVWTVLPWCRSEEDRLHDKNCRLPLVFPTEGCFGGFQGMILLGPGIRIARYGYFFAPFIYFLKVLLVFSTSTEVL